MPSNADIETLELSKNDFAELDYTDGKAVITFKKAGEASLFFTANGNIDSSAAAITITDKAAEQAAAEQAAAEQAAAEQAAAAQAQQNTDTTVYWTPNGEVYHSTPNCPSLSRSKTILSGSIEESGKSRGCKNCY